MFTLSLPPEGGGRMVAAARKWMGPILAGLFAIAVVALLPAAEESLLARWTLTSTLAFERILPMVGLGALFGLVGIRVLGAAFLLLVLGIIGGLIAEDRLLRLLDAVPQAAAHDFLAGPISYLAVGVALAAGSRWCAVLAPIAALLSGTMLGLIIRLTDPSLHEPAYIWTPVLIACWIILAVSLTVRGFGRSWFPVFARILGSWLLAIGLLYGGVMFVPKRQAPLPLPAAPSPEIGRPFPGIDQSPEQPGPDALPGSLKEAPE